MRYLAGVPSRPILPESLERILGVQGGSEWLESLPGLIEDTVAAWDVELGDPFPGSYVSIVFPATRRDGEESVLKIQFPHAESTHEAAALAEWQGDGAVRLLDHDPARHALLLERCFPGTHLSAAGPDTALDVLVGLVSRLSVPAGEPFTPLAAEAAGWLDDIPRHWEAAGRSIEERLVAAAVDALRSLLDDEVEERVLLHQDLHGDNVLAATREPWLVIDPKPLVGDPAFAVAPIVRSSELGHSPKAVRYRFDRLTGDLGLDRDRARAWAVGQTLAWAFEGGRVLGGHVDVVRWLAE